jgi:hypothetical protein
VAPPAQALAQHTPSTHVPMAQSAFVLQPPPMGERVVEYVL